jgi:hypothetical protein
MIFSNSSHWVTKKLHIISSFISSSEIARNHFFYFLIIYSILKITDAAADPMNCIFSNSLLEEIVSFDVTGAVGSYVITLNLYQCDPSTNSDVNYGGMASSSESVGMAYDSITNQIYLTDASKHRILQVSDQDNRHLIRVVADPINDPSPGYVNGIGTLAQFNTPSGLAISSLTPPSPPSAAAATGYGLNSTHWLVIVGIIVFVKLS